LKIVLLGPVEHIAYAVFRSRHASGDTSTDRAGRPPRSGTGLYRIASIRVVGFPAASWVTKHRISTGHFDAKVRELISHVSQLHSLGLVEANHAWINASTALYWVAIAFVWHISPLGAFFFLAALQTVPDSLYQAARIDRAPAFKRFLHVALPHLRVEGLMTIAPIAPNPEDTRPVFRQLRLLRDHMRNEIPQCDWQQLSMGMTDDYRVAIEEGATIVRIGRAIFGERTYT